MLFYKALTNINFSQFRCLQAINLINSIYFYRWFCKFAAPRIVLSVYFDRINTFMNKYVKSKCEIDTATFFTEDLLILMIDLVFSLVF